MSSTHPQFERDGVMYRMVKLDTFKQLHILRKVSPLIPTLIPLFSKIKELVSQAKDKDALAQDIGVLAEVLTPLTEQLAALKDDDFEYVMRTCMCSFQRQAGDGWMPVWLPNGNKPVDDKINDPMIILGFVRRALEANLGPFLTASLTALQGLQLSSQTDPKS